MVAANECLDAVVACGRAQTPVRVGGQQEPESRHGLARTDLVDGQGNCAVGRLVNGAAGKAEDPPAVGGLRTAGCRQADVGATGQGLPQTGDGGRQHLAASVRMTHNCRGVELAELGGTVEADRDGSGGGPARVESADRLSPPRPDRQAHGEHGALRGGSVRCHHASAAEVLHDPATENRTIAGRVAERPGLRPGVSPVCSDRLENDAGLQCRGHADEATLAGSNDALQINGPHQTPDMLAGIDVGAGDLGEFGIHDGLQLAITAALLGEDLVQPRHRAGAGDAVVLDDVGRDGQTFVVLELSHDVGGAAAVVAVDGDRVAEVGQSLLNRGHGGRVVGYVDDLIAVRVEAR